jgi:hypothetical protein
MDPITAGALISGGAQIIGSGIQSIFGSDAQEEELKAKKEAAERLKQMGQITDAEYNALISQIDQYYQNRPTLGNQQDINAYRQALAQYNPEEYAAEVGDFDKTYNKEDYLNPYYGNIIADTANQIQHTAAGAGLGRGTGAALNIAKGTAEKSDELYRTAMQEMNQDRSFDYQNFQDAITNQQNRLNALRAASETKIGLTGNLAQDYLGTQDQAMADRMKAQQDRLNAQTGYAGAIASLY